MNNQEPDSKPETVEEPRDEGLSSSVLLAFGSKVLADLLQGEWEPDWEWREEMIEIATEHGLVTTRPADQEDDPEEYDYIYERLAPVVPFPANDSLSHGDGSATPQANQPIKPQ